MKLSEMAPDQLGFLARQVREGLLQEEIARLRADNAALREALAETLDEWEAYIRAEYRKLLAPTETGGGE